MRWWWVAPLVWLAACGDTGPAPGSFAGQDWVAWPTPSATEPPELPPAPLVPPRYAAGSGAWTRAMNVCTDDDEPAPFAARVATLAARDELPVVAAGAGCDWLLTLAGAPPALDGDALAAWQAAGDQAERFVLETAAGAPLVTSIYAPDLRGARYAAQAAFSLLARFPSASGRMVPQSVLVDWPAFSIRGVVEGFYGPPFPDADRVSLLGWLDEGRENTYVYGPQNDDYAHADWYELYPADALAALGHAVQEAAARDLEFVWAVRPGQGQFYPSMQPIVYSSDSDFARLTAKLEQLRSVGVTRFGLFFDDNVENFTSTVDQMMFGSLAEAQTYLVNRVDDYLHAEDPSTRLYLVGTRYSASATDWQTYNQYFRDHLHPTVDVLWTGNETYSQTISAADIQPVAASLGRAPVIWDNEPQAVAGLSGRSTDLPEAAQGLLSNPVICSWQHAPASAFVDILGTAAMYTWRPDAYDSTTALDRWRAAKPALGAP